MKKRGFGQGKWNGYGGKLQPGETLAAAMLREIQEEGGVVAAATDLVKVAVLKFFFVHDTAWNQEVHVFILRKWNGQPTETEEMRPQWFAFDRIPYNQMWVDDKHWLPNVLAGKKIEAEFYFRTGAETLEKFDVRELN